MITGATAAPLILAFGREHTPPIQVMPGEETNHHGGGDDEPTQCVEW